jgi:hypothetical protein
MGLLTLYIVRRFRHAANRTLCVVVMECAPARMPITATIVIGTIAPCIHHAGMKNEFNEK